MEGWRSGCEEGREHCGIEVVGTQSSIEDCKQRGRRLCGEWRRVNIAALAGQARELAVMKHTQKSGKCDYKG